MIARGCVIGLCAPLLVSAAPPGVVEVQISVTGLRSEHGVVRACMTTDPERFPRCRGDDTAHSLVVPAEQAGSIAFAKVRPGTYAIALLHDENANGKADRALGMIPKEGFGFSRDARVKMGPPAFGEAAFVVGANPLRQSIRMRYLL